MYTYSKKSDMVDENICLCLWNIVLFISECAFRFLIIARAKLDA